MNNCVHFMWSHVFTFLGYVPGSRISVLHGNSPLNLLRNCKTIFQNGRSISQDYQQYMRIPISPYPCKICYCLSLLQPFQAIILCISLWFWVFQVFFSYTVSSLQHLQLWSMGFYSWAQFPNQGLNSHPLHQKVDSFFFNLFILIGG